jgi:hypothetical protein
MLVLSLLVTVAVQMVLALLGLRGKNLLWGTARLLKQIEPDFTEAMAKELAEKLLTHPALPHFGNRPTTAISETEFRKVLEDVARARNTLLSDETCRKLRVYMGLLDSSGQLQATADRLAAGAAKLAGDAGKWFDMIISRTSERFQFHTRLVTASVAGVACLALQIDALSVMKQLSASEELRARVISQVDSIEARAKSVLDRGPLAGRPLQTAISNVSAEKQVTAEGNNALDQGSSDYAALKDTLAKMQLEIVPSSLDPGNYVRDPRHLLGVVLAAMLLGLGAPFWFNVLRQLSTLRPLIAQKVDPKVDQRT